MSKPRVMKVRTNFWVRLTGFREVSGVGLMATVRVVYVRWPVPHSSATPLGL